jgi:hypothetical protein
MQIARDSAQCTVQVNKLEITADKQLLAAAGNPAVKIFEVAAAAPQPIHSFDGHTGNVTGSCAELASCLTHVGEHSIKL